MPRGRRAVLLAALAVALLSVVVFLPAVDGAFLNWDDQEVFVRNDALRAPRIVAWAFSTRYMEHYQPLAWAAWAGVDRAAGLTPRAAHTLNLVLHALCAALVFLLVRRVVSATLPAVLAALVWAIHPLRVEAVAWASAMPYTLALLFALIAALAWNRSHAWRAAALLGASLLVRPLALTAPLVFWWMKRPARQQEGAALAVMVICAAAAGAVESSARLTASLADFGPGARATLAAKAPWIYLWRTAVPVNLTPLDPLALSPRTEPGALVLGLAGILVVSAAAWRWRREQPVLAGAWASYLLLLVPAAGLVPSGLQATADRYTYLPAIPISIAIAHLLARARTPALANGPALAVAAALAVLTWRQTSYWRDSIALWTRAVEIDARNDVALYNLASALGDGGHRTEAIERYEQVLALAPNHAAARRNRDLLEAERLEEEANGLAAASNFREAIDRYARAVRLDPRRTHSHAALGIALLELGRGPEARQPLQTAIDQGATDPAVANALAYVLASSGERDRAIAVLREAQRHHPEDVRIRRNLAMLEGAAR